MPVTEQQMRDRFPSSFAAPFPQVILLDALAEAELRIDRTVLGDLADRAQLYLAAHLASADARSAGEGLSSATAGPVSVVFDRAFQRQNFFEEYRRIIRLTTFGVTVSGCA